MRALLFLAMLALGLRVLAAESEMSGRFIVRAWQSEDGLPGNVVRSIAQAVDGYLWVATAEGLVRFDGVRFTGFAGEPEATLARLPPRALFPLADGSVWISTARGGLLRGEGARLRAVFRELEGTSPPSVTQVLADGPGRVLIVRGTELWRVEKENAPEEIARTPELEARLATDLEAWSQRGRGPNPQLRDPRGRHWALSPTGGLSVRESEASATSVALPLVEPGNRFTEMTLDREGNLWLATGESGLLQVRDRRAEVLTVADGLGDRTAFALLEDRSGTLWIASKRGGLDRLAHGQVAHFPVGDGTSNRPVNALCEDRHGTLWAATRHGSILRWEDGVFRVAFGPDPAPAKVAAIVEDARGHLWFGGQQGLARWADGAMTRFGAGDGLPDVDITTLATSPEGELWVGCSDGRLFRGRDGKFSAVAADDALGRRTISALLADHEGTLWGATLGGGLFCVRGTAYERFTASSGLPDERLTAVLDDTKGSLWIGSLAGIFRVEKDALARIASGHETTANWLQIDRRDGLLTRECTGGFQPAGWRTQDGTLLFPTVNGVARIRPASLVLNPVPPPVVIEQCRANGRLLKNGGAPLETGPGRSRLEFHYTGLSFSAPEKVRFRLRLAGLENEWREVGAQRTAAYEAVPPGNYRFEVRAANADGVWNETGAALAIRVRPHFWETTWFRTLSAVLAAAAATGVGWGIARGRMRRRLARLELEHAREAERSRIARDLHDELGASLTEISMLAALAAEESSEATRAPLHDITAKAHTLVGALDEIVWAVDPRRDSLASLADYLAAFGTDFLDTAGLALRLDVARDLPPLALDAEQRHGLFLAVREALNNAVKHSGAEEIWLRLAVENGRLQITIEDHGRGFDPATASRGEGLRNLHERLIALGGECRIETMVTTGTRVCLSLPLIPP